MTRCETLCVSLDSLDVSLLCVHQLSNNRIGQTKKVTIIKMVSKNTVDEDIYRMQQRKAKMNAAIMDTCDEWKKSTATVTKEVLEVAVNRFLHSPEAKIRQSSVKENVANQEVIEIL